MQSIALFSPDLLLATQGENLEREGAHPLTPSHMPGGFNSITSILQPAGQGDGAGPADEDQGGVDMELDEQSPSQMHPNDAPVPPPNPPAEHADMIEGEDDRMDFVSLLPWSLGDEPPVCYSDPRACWTAPRF
jgi:hypothetical protein